MLKGWNLNRFDIRTKNSQMKYLKCFLILIVGIVSCECDEYVNPYEIPFQIQFVDHWDSPIINEGNFNRFKLERQIEWDEIALKWLHEPVEMTHEGGGVISFQVKPTSKPFDMYRDWYKISFDNDPVYPFKYSFGIYCKLSSGDCNTVMLQDTEIRWGALSYYSINPYGPYVILFPN